MIKYITNYTEDGYNVEEIRWNLKDCNRIVIHSDIEDAIDEVNMLNEIVYYYREFSLI